MLLRLKWLQIVFSLATAALSASAMAQSVGEIQVKAPAFRIEKNGKVAYILGTLHQGIEYSWLSQNIKDTADRADTLVVETDVDLVGPILADAFPMGKNNSLRDQLTPKEWERLSSVLLEALGQQSRDVIDQLHPTIAANIYSNSFYPATLEPIDLTLIGRAKLQRKTILYFEDPTVQVGALQDAMTVDSLKRTLALSKADSEALVLAMLLTYSRGDLKGLEKVVKFEMTERETKILLDQRNRAWLQRFNSIFERAGTEVFAVGAAHLIGESGLIRGLRAKGYTLSPL